MKKRYKTIGLFCFAASGMVLAEPPVAQPCQPTQPQAVTESARDTEDEEEFYDYNSGVTYSHSLFNYVYRKLDPSSHTRPSAETKPGESAR